jgi:hypothetical protein
MYERKVRRKEERQAGCGTGSHVPNASIHMEEPGASNYTCTELLSVYPSYLDFCSFCSFDFQLAVNFKP